MVKKTFVINKQQYFADESQTNVINPGADPRYRVGQSQTYSRWDDESLILDNGVIRRMIRMEQPLGKIFSSSMQLSDDGQEFLTAGTEEFAFSLNGKRFSGTDTWSFISTSPVQDENGGHGAEVTLESVENKIRISITYLLYPDLPVIRKRSPSPIFPARTSASNRSTLKACGLISRVPAPNAG